MTSRWRAIRYGPSFALAVIGVACGATISGSLGGTLATVLIGIGLVGVVSLVFYEIGCSEDRDRARCRSQPPLPPAPAGSEPAARPDRAGRPRRLDRKRGERRRLR